MAVGRRDHVFVTVVFQSTEFEAQHRLRVGTVLLRFVACRLGDGPLLFVGRHEELCKFSQTGLRQMRLARRRERIVRA